jgi:alcohol dehydrogenase class IV
MVTTTDFEFASPTTITAGAETASGIHEVLGEFGAERPLLVTDSNLVEVGVLDPIEAALEANELEYSVFDGVVPNPKAKTIEGAATQFEEAECDSIVAIGGGSSIDTAKCTSILAEHGGEIQHYYGPYTVPGPITVPTVAVPTTAGTGSEVTPAAVVSDPEAEQKMSILAEEIAPSIAVLDPTLLTSLPPQVTAGTGMDALTQAIMPYLSPGANDLAPGANPITDAFALQAVRLIGENLPKATAGDDVDAYANMQIATTLGGIAFTNAGLGLVHAMSHTVGGFFDTPHGITNGVLLPHVLRYTRIAREEEFAELASALGRPTDGLSRREASMELVVAVEDMLTDLDLPTRLRDLGVEEDALEELAEAAVTREFFLVENSPRNASEEDVLEIFQQAY